MTVQDAAKALGITVDAIRKRVERDTIEYEKDTDTGRVWILLDDRQAAGSTTTGQEHARHDTDREELLEELRDRVRFLERQLDREREAHGETRRIAAMLAQRVPELEAVTSPPEPRGSPESATADAGRGTGPEPETTAQRRSWWRRIIGG